MKNQFFKTMVAIIAINLLFVACSSESSSDNNNTDSKITGTWKPIKAIFTDSGGSMNTENFSDCEQTGRTTFTSNGDFAQTGYYTVTTCELEFDNTGNWQIINDNILRITVNGQVDNGSIGDYLITGLTDTMLKIDADTDPNSIESEVYVFEKVN